jgi:hypothetical protein
MYGLASGLRRSTRIVNLAPMDITGSHFPADYFDLSSVATCWTHA